VAKQNNGAGTTSSLNLPSNRAVGDRSSSLLTRSLYSIAAKPRATGTSNNTLTTASALGTFTGRRTIKDTVGKTTDPVDLFSFQVADTSKLKLSFQNNSKASITSAVLDAQGNVLFYNGRKQSSSVKSGVTSETQYGGVTPGTYYLKIQSKAKGDSPYKLTLAINKQGSGSIEPLPCGCGV
jgi:hypothetical protein